MTTKKQASEVSRAVVGRIAVQRVSLPAYAVRAPIEVHPIAHRMRIRSQSSIPNPSIDAIKLRLEMALAVVQSGGKLEAAFSHGTLLCWRVREVLQAACGAPPGDWCAERFRTANERVAVVEKAIAWLEAVSS